MSTTRLSLGPLDHGRRLGLDEFLEADVTPGYRYELARGVVEATEVPDDPHERVVRNLRDLVAHHKRDHPGVVRTAGGGGEFRLWAPEMESGRNPDLAVVLFGAGRDLRGRLRPQIVAEVVSPGSEDRDHRGKPEEYALHGTLEYWIVDPRERRVTALARQAESRVERELRDGDVLTTPLLPGFAARVEDLWIDAELDGDS